MDITVVKILKWNRNLNVWEQITFYTKERNKFYIINPYPFWNNELLNSLNNTLYQKEYNIPTYACTNKYFA